MVKKYDKEFQKIKDKYDTIEMNISEDREMLKTEKAKLYSHQENQNFFKKGVVYGGLLTLFCALVIAFPIGVVSQIVVGSLAFALGGMTIGFLGKAFSYKDKIIETENTVKIVEDRLKGYENDRKVLSNDINNYFSKSKQPNLVVENAAKMPEYVAPQNNAVKMPEYVAEKSDAVEMPKYQTQNKDDGMNL